MREKKHKFTAVFIFSMFLLLSAVITVFAADASVTYGSGSYSATQGETFQVGVYLKGSEAIGAYEFYLDYNADMLEYVSGADSGGSGRLKFTGYGNADSYSYMLTFKAKTAGSCNISITNAYAGPLDPASGDSMNITSAASATVTIQGPNTASDECRLSELSISPTGLWGFSPDKTNYDITVDNDITKLAISATPQDSKATVVISDTNLEVGVNTITIKVTAENGAVKNYEIIVRRKEEQAPTETTTPVKVPEIEELNTSTSFNVNGKDYYFYKDVNNISAPDGFQKTTVTYKNEEVPAFTSLTQNVTLFYLDDGLGGQGSFYIYDSQKDTVYPYISLNNPSGSYILLSADETVTAPDGYQSTTVSLSNGSTESIATSVTAWVTGDSTEFFLLYVLNSEGEKGFYQYDSKERTLQRYNGAVPASNNTDPSGPLTPEDQDKVSALQAELNQMKADNQKDANSKLIIIIALAAFCVILLAAVVGMILKLRGQIEIEGQQIDDEYDSFELMKMRKKEKKEKGSKYKIQDQIEEKELLEESKAAQLKELEYSAAQEEIKELPKDTIEIDAEELRREMRKITRHVQKNSENEEEIPKKEPPRREPSQPAQETNHLPKVDLEDEDDFLLDLDDDDFTFFDYDDDGNSR